MFMLNFYLSHTRGPIEDDTWLSVLMHDYAAKMIVESVIELADEYD